jgi:class 3 adenylate cyclase
MASRITDPTALERARKALEDHAWHEAFDGFFEADRSGELAAEDLERLSEAAWWTAHPSESIDAAERAYAAYLAAGNRNRAAFMAGWLAVWFEDQGDPRVANGWSQRAIRLSEGQPDSVEVGYIELRLVKTSLEQGAIEVAQAHADHASQIAERFGDPDLQAFATCVQGVMLIAIGRVQDGFVKIDEATAAAVGGELSPIMGGRIYCITIGMCKSVADYRRAAEWTEAASRWCERYSITGFPGVCRIQRAEIMRLRGSLVEAEEEATRARAELTAYGSLVQAAEGSYEIGEVRLRLGDLDGAEEAFGKAHEFGREPQPGIALVQLARKRIEAARASLDMALGDAMDPFSRARLLPARAEIAVAAGDPADARSAAEELSRIAATFDTPMLHAAAHQALGTALLAEGDAPTSIAELRTAVRHWTEADAPFEAAQARRWLGAACRAVGDEASAALELRSAKAAFVRLGARLEIERTEEMVRAGAAESAGRRVVRTFMFTDIVGSTELLGTIGDEMWEDVLRWHDETLRTLIGSQGGSVVHTTGDGFFASFADVVDAVACAAAIQQRLLEHRREHGFAPPVRIGLHAAEATEVGEDYAGLGVHEAARVGAAAQGGEILVTMATIADVDLPFRTADEREVSLKGLARPVEVVTIDWHGDSA